MVTWMSSLRTPGISAWTTYPLSFSVTSILNRDRGRVAHANRLEEAAEELVDAGVGEGVVYTQIGHLDLLSSVREGADGMRRRRPPTAADFRLSPAKWRHGRPVSRGRPRPPAGGGLTTINPRGRRSRDDRAQAPRRSKESHVSRHPVRHRPRPPESRTRGAARHARRRGRRAAQGQRRHARGRARPSPRGERRRGRSPMRWRSWTSPRSAIWSGSSPMSTRPSRASATAGMANASTAGSRSPRRG